MADINSGKCYVRVSDVAMGSEAQRQLPGLQIGAFLLTLNGRALEVGDSTELPSLAGAAVAGGAPMVVAPVSIGWMVFPQAGAAECMRQLV